ncbi:MAG: recombinase A [Myxococcota bacterium]
MNAVTKLRQTLRRKAPKSVLPAEGRPPPSPHAPELAPRWARGELVGRLTEISAHAGGSVLTVATGLVLSAQSDNEPVAWVTHPDRLFFPPDLAASGVDLDALVVIRIGRESHSKSSSGRSNSASLARAADKLLRSGAFGLVIVDLGQDDVISQALQSRLVGLAQKHDSAVVLLTQKSAQHGSVGSLVSLRAQAKRIRLGVGRFACELEVVKDKRRGPGWTHREPCCGPMGLR